VVAAGREKNAESHPVVRNAHGSRREPERVHAPVDTHAAAGLPYGVEHGVPDGVPMVGAHLHQQVAVGELRVEVVVGERPHRLELCRLTRRQPVTTIEQRRAHRDRDRQIVGHYGRAEQVRLSGGSPGRGGGGVPPLVRNAARSVSVRNRSVSSQRLPAVVSKERKMAAVCGGVAIPA
jgi:hypothetical protein